MSFKKILQKIKSKFIVLMTPENLVKFISSPLRVSLLITLLAIFCLVFFVDSKYKSSSIINITDIETSPNIQNSIISSFVTDSPESLYQLKEFFESENGFNELNNLIDFNEAYGNRNIKYFSRLGTLYNSNSEKYYKKMLTFTILSDSSSIMINSYGFDPENSYRLNLVLINIASEFFDRRDRLAASIALAKKRCELKISESQDINDVTIYNQNQKIDFESFDSAYAMIYEKSKQFYQSCIDYDVVEDPLSLKLPKSTLIDVKSFTSQQLIGEIFDSKMDSLTITDKISIVAEPQKPTRPEDKRVLIISIIVFLISYITMITIRIVAKLKEEFSL